MNNQQQTRRDTILIPRQEIRLVPKTISLKKQNARMKGKNFKVKKAPKPKSVKPIERSYFYELRDMVLFLQELINKYLVARLPEITKAGELSRPQLDSLKADAYDDMIDGALNETKTEFFREYTDEELRNIAERISKKINGFNDENFKKAFKSVLGIDYMNFEPWLQTSIRAFTKENVSLIKSIPNQFFDRIEQQVLRGVQSGKLTSDITKDIQNIYGVTERRAALIARDQVNKFNGNLAQQRQTSVGIEKYIWRTAKDERVRTEHEAREGDVFKWDDPPEDGHPGEPINCRCYAEPVFES